MAITPTPLQTPGTPAIKLPEYVAPVFTSPSVPVGGAITTVVFEDVAEVSPFTFGQVFKIGELAPTDTLVGRITGIEDIPLQLDVKATHKDGSVRHGIISGVTHKNGEMFLIRSLKTEAPDHQLRAKDVEVVVVEAGIEYRAQAHNSKGWLLGPVAVELIGFEDLISARGDKHPFLRVQINERTYSTGQAKFDVTLEHTNTYTTNGFKFLAPTEAVPNPAPIPAQVDITYDVKIISDGVEVYSKLGLVHFPGARWKKTFWQGGKPSLHVKHNSAYFIATKAVPNYDPSIVMSEITLASYAADLKKFSFEPMATGRFQPVMSAPGGRPDIGLAPDCYAATIISGDKRAKALMLESANVAGSWAAHRRLPDDTMLDVIKYPYATILGNPGDTLNPATKQYEKLPPVVTASKLENDTSHQPAFAYIPYLLTGDYFYLEELLFWCNYNAYRSNPYYRMFEKGWVKSDQIRGQGWSIRTLAEAAYITPDSHPQKTAFKYWLDNTMEYYRINFTDGSSSGVKVVERRVTVVDPVVHNELGMILDAAPGLPYAVKGIAGVGMSLYMDDFFTQGVGHAAELGCEEAGRLLKWKAKFQVGRMIADGYCPNDAAMYVIRVKDSAAVDTTAKLAQPFYKTLKQCWDNTKEVAELVCSPVVELTGYPGATAGFPSNYQPALAYATDSGYEGGSKAWALFMSRKTKPDYNTSPQFAIVPRTSAVVTPPQPPSETLPPVVVVPPPPVTPIAKMLITNIHFRDLKGLTVTLSSESNTKFYSNLQSDSAGVIEIVDNSLTSGAKYTAVIFNSNGEIVGSIHPVIVI